MLLFVGPQDGLHHVPPLNDDRGLAGLQPFLVTKLPKFAADEDLEVHAFGHLVILLEVLPDALTFLQPLTLEIYDRVGEALGETFVLAEVHSIGERIPAFSGGDLAQDVPVDGVEIAFRV
jgi:hypothetical protein